MTQETETIVETATSNGDIDWGKFDNMHTDYTTSPGVLRTVEQVKQRHDQLNHAAIKTYVDNTYKAYPEIFKMAINWYYGKTGMTRTKIAEKARGNLEGLVEANDDIIRDLDQEAAGVLYEIENVRRMVAEKKRQYADLTFYISTATQSVEDISKILTNKRAGQDTDYSQLRTGDKWQSYSDKELIKFQTQFQRELPRRKSEKRKLEAEVSRLDKEYDMHILKGKNLERKQYEQDGKTEVVYNDLASTIAVNVDAPDAIEVKIAKNDVKAARQLGVNGKVADAVNKAYQKTGGVHAGASWAPFQSQSSQGIRDTLTQEIEDYDKKLQQSSEQRSVGIEGIFDKIAPA